MDEPERAAAVETDLPAVAVGVDDHALMAVGAAFGLFEAVKV